MEKRYFISIEEQTGWKIPWEKINFKTIEEQTGWKRPFKYMICQDINILQKIHTFSYDLENEDFLKYFLGRIGSMITMTDIGWDNEKKLLHPDNEPDEISDKITKGKLQDCWELYQMWEV